MEDDSISGDEEKSTVKRTYPLSRRWSQRRVNQLIDKGMVERAVLVLHQPSRSQCRSSTSRAAFSRSPLLVSSGFGPSSLSSRV